MTITKRNEVTQTIDPQGNINVLTVTIIEENGSEIARSNHRDVLSPGDNTSGKPSEVAAVAAVVWTQEKIRASQELKARTAPKV